MKERPILMNPEMVRAVLQGRKSMTRRVMKPQPVTSDKVSGLWLWNPTPRDHHLLNKDGSDAVPGFEKWMQAMCPYGQPSDRLWVRETWCHHETAIPPGFFYRASEPFGNARLLAPWKPSIFMPRRASRITLEITDVRVERVQDITEDDCRREGINANRLCDGGEILTDDNRTLPKALFQDLWDSINAKRGYGWNVNPWVWCLSFRVLK